MLSLNRESPLRRPRIRSEKRLGLWAADQVLVTLPCDRSRISRLSGRSPLPDASENQAESVPWIASSLAAKNSGRTLEPDESTHFVVSAPTNVSYLTGFSGDSSVLILGRERDLIVSDGRFTTQLAQECPGLEAHIRLPGQEMNAGTRPISSEPWGCGEWPSRRRAGRSPTTRRSARRRPPWRFARCQGAGRGVAADQG